MEIIFSFIILDSREHGTLINKLRKIIVTSALPYANGDIHVGHLLEHIQTDIWVTHLRMSGHHVLSFCADDAHGAPIMMKAEELHLKPEDFIGPIREAHISSLAKYGVAYSNYHSTHSSENQELSNEIYLAAKDAGYIYKKEIEQCFDETKGMFLADRYVSGECPKCGEKDQYGDGCDKCGEAYSATELLHPRSTLTGSTPVLKNSEHIFFDLEQSKDHLKNFLTTANIQKPIVAKLSEWLDGDLKSWDISRDNPYFGFSIPGEYEKYFYVWVDAPIGYLASAQNWAVANACTLDFLWGKDSEYEIHHFIGKDITYFHGLFWPALLQASKYKLPTDIHVHGFITVNGEKMSKSKGTFITADQFAEVCNPELLRYYYASKLNSKIEDLDLNLEDLSQKINSDLVGKFSNIFSRSAPFVLKNKNILALSLDENHLKDARIFESEVCMHLEAKDYSKGLKLIMEIADNTNKYINEQKPWKLDDEAALVVATTAINVFKNLCILLLPVIPVISAQLLKMLGVTNATYAELSKILIGVEIEEFQAVLSRVEPLNINQFHNKDENMEDKSEDFISIDDFMKVDMRVAEVIEASHVEGADKLISVKLNLGELGQKIVFAGIKSAYDPLDLVGKLVVMAYNLAPRKMKFGISEGMILAASDSEGGIFVISPDNGAKPGQRIK